MAFDYVKDLVAIAVGGAHIWAKKRDLKKATPPDPLKGDADIAAVAGVGLGLVLQLWMPKYEKYGEALRLASWPFLATAVYNSMVEAGDRINASPRPVSMPAAPVFGRRISSSAPEFQKVSII